MKKIESLQNPLIKHLVQLRTKSKIRRQTQTFLMEGVREISLAVKGKYELEKILFSPTIISENEIKKKFLTRQNASKFLQKFTEN